MQQGSSKHDVAPPPAEGEGTGSSIDARVDEASRRGLTGTARSDVYETTRDPDDVSRAPNPWDERDPPRWRQDFPIDWPKDEFVARRDFAKFLVLTSGAFVAGQAWIAARDLVRSKRESGEPLRQRIASLAEVPVGGVLSFSYPTERDHCLLVRISEHEIVAFNQSCTHLSCAVVPRVSQGVFECPCHEGYFDLRTGVNIAGPPPRPLPRIVLEVVSGDVFATGVQQRTVG
jgi:Rieske Fe-S protein